MSGPKIGVVGLGTMGHIHASNARQVGGEVVAGADVSADARESFTREFGASVYDSHEDMLDEASVDAVVITTPNAFHESVAVAALDADCDVMIEKPLADSLEAGKQIATAEDRSEGFCMVGFHNRFSPAAITAKSYAERGRFGEITHVEANYVRRRGIPAPGSWFTNAELAGGGALIDVGVHVIDFVLYLLGFPEITEVSGVSRSEFGSRPDYADPDGFGGSWTERGGSFDVDDSASAFLRCADGRTISLEVAWATNREPTNDVLLRGTEAGGRLEVGGDDLELYETGTAGIDHHVSSTITGELARHGHLAEVEVFLDAVERGQPPEENTVAEALTVQRIVEAIYESSNTERAVPLAEAVVPSPAD